jgi:dihydrofolate synthase / folylpolyglutamate synthase
VNAFEPDCAVLTSVGLDHMEYLGNTRELIGSEKAGIFRAGKPAVVAEPSPPASVLERADAIGADLHLVDRDFGYTGSQTQWQFWDWLGKRSNLPLPALRGEYQLQNAAAVLAALDALRDQLAVDMGAIRRGLVEVELPGRFQVLPGTPTIVLDVAHNPHAAVRFAQTLRKLDAGGRRLAVFAMLKDKDIEGVLDVTKSEFDAWYVAPLSLPRGAHAARLQQALTAVGVTAPVQRCEDIAGALRAAREAARSDDKIIVFGSFYTVAEALRTLPGVSGNPSP